VQQHDVPRHPEILTATRDTYLLLRAFVDELARCGMTDACTSPGSRSTPIVASLVRDGRLRCHSHVDERSGGFFALGLAKATGRPVAIACTSGTAAANLAPAVIEAHEARVPMVVLTADRPAELREVGAGQTIDQIKLYGGAAKWFFEVGTHDATEARLRWVRALACRAYWTALEGRPGPVHLNWPLREPLVLDEELPEDEGGRPEGRPWVARPPVRATPLDPVLDALTDLVAANPRVAVVAGRYERDDGLAQSAQAFAAATGACLLADPLSGARAGANAVAHYDALLRDETFAAAQRPDLVVRVGDLPTSKPLRAWLASLGETPQLALDAEGTWQDPDAVIGGLIASDPALTLRALASRVRAADPAWLASWRDADARAAAAILDVLGDELSEPRSVTALAGALPADATLVVSSSMPVRDVETFWPIRDDGPRVLSNRGANGIDGVVSTAFGVAAGATGPVVALLGDVALAHDVGGLLAARRLGLAPTIVVLNNGGGGIFDFLPVSGETDLYEHHVATPTELDLAQVARTFGLHHELVTAPNALVAALGRTGTARLVEVRTDRAGNVELHRRVWTAVAAALSRRAPAEAPPA
jgi:2-succinyl-5-enolpyruvyl-6-hydroxy-3-cyclohexene-1-carboxylate synthase